MVDEGRDCRGFAVIAQGYHYDRNHRQFDLWALAKYRTATSYLEEVDSGSFMNLSRVWYSPSYV